MKCEKCGKEGIVDNIRKHIEAHHYYGVSHTCITSVEQLPGPELLWLYTGAGNINNTFVSGLEML